jgi:DNA-binding transcriptional ArsR family regulator
MIFAFLSYQCRTHNRCGAQVSDREISQSMSKQGKKAAEASSPLPTHLVTDLAQIRALADPLRLRILGALGCVPRTTKQVADLLGEKPTRLYHHVEALERVGLLRLTGTRPNRGTVEKYYQAVAVQFQVAVSAPSADTAAGEELSAQEAMLTSILEQTGKELLASIRHAPGGLADTEEAPFVARVTLTASLKKVRALRRQLLNWIEKLRSAGAQAKGQSAQDKVTCTFTAVFCRTDRPEGNLDNLNAKAAR